jgi:hypothetical protein
MLRANDAMQKRAIGVLGRKYAKHHRVEFRVLRVDHTFIEGVSDGAAPTAPCLFVLFVTLWCALPEPSAGHGSIARFRMA